MFAILLVLSLLVQMVKESACNAGDPGLIPGLGRSPGWEDPLRKGMATDSSILAWEITRTKEAGGLQSIGALSQTRLSN